MRIQLSLFWIGSGTQNIHQAIESSNNGLTPFAYKDYNLSGGHAINGLIGPGDYDCAGFSNLSPSMPGFCDKPEEVGLDSGAKYRVSGASGKFKEYDI